MAGILDLDGTGDPPWENRALTSTGLRKTEGPGHRLEKNVGQDTGRGSLAGHEDGEKSATWRGDKAQLESQT